MRAGQPVVCGDNKIHALGQVIFNIGADDVLLIPDQQCHYEFHSECIVLIAVRIVYLNVAYKNQSDKMH